MIDSALLDVIVTINDGSERLTRTRPTTTTNERWWRRRRQRRRLPTAIDRLFRVKERNGFIIERDAIDSLESYLPVT